MQRFVWIVLLVALGIRIYASQPDYSVGDSLRISGRLMTEPIRFSDTQYFRFAGLKVYLPLYPSVSYGDHLVIEGKMGEKYLEDVVLVSHEETTSPIFVTRNKLIHFYQSSLPEPHAALVSGITLGAKSSMPESFWNNLKSTGTAHVVVASGMNVAMTASFVMSLLLIIISRKKAVIITIVSIWIYTLMSGFDAPIVRAAIMGSIAFSAQGLGRLSESLRLLFISAIIMLFANPRWGTDLGFILSFLATLSLILFESKIRNRIQFIPGVFREGLSTSLAAQIGVAPVIFYVFGQFNLFSPAINALILWTIAPIMVISSIAGAIGLLVPQLGALIILLSLPLTSWFVYIVNLLG